MYTSFKNRGKNVIKICKYEWTSHTTIKNVPQFLKMETTEVIMLVL